MDVLYAILCGRTNLEMELLKNTYNKENTEDLNHLISSKLRGDNERLIQISMAANEQEYDPSIHTKEKAAEDTDFIHDEKNMFEIICAAPPKYLELINEVYEEQYGLTLEKAIEKGLGGKAKEGLLQTVGMKLRPIETIAKLIKHACAGMGTNELLLSTTIIRHQNVMDKVMAAHFELFKKVRRKNGGFRPKVIHHPNSFHRLFTIEFAVSVAESSGTFFWPFSMLHIRMRRARLRRTRRR